MIQQIIDPVFTIVESDIAVAVGGEVNDILIERQLFDIGFEGSNTKAGCNEFL
jgi:hypothetical protein